MSASELQAPGEPQLSFLDILNICDNTRINRPSLVPSPFDSELLVPLYLSPSPDSPIIGLLRPAIVEQLKVENERSRQNNLQALWDIQVAGSTSNARPRISFQAWLDTPSKRTSAMRDLCERWRDTGLFHDVCGPTKWRAEMYPIYSDPFGVHDHPRDSDDGRTLNYAFEMERAACALFGVVTYGVHMTIYQEKEESGVDRSLSIWVPTRSRTKQTYAVLVLYCKRKPTYSLDGPVSWTTLSPVAFRVA